MLPARYATLLFCLLPFATPATRAASLPLIFSPLMPLLPLRRCHFAAATLFMVDCCCHDAWLPMPR